MPLPTDQQLLKTSQDLITEFKVVNGKHPGFRPGQAPHRPKEMHLS